MSSKISKKMFIENAENHNGFQHMIEDVFVHKMYPGSRSARIVINEKTGDVELLCTDTDTLVKIKNALVSGATVRGKRIRMPSKHDLEAFWDDFYSLPMSQQKKIIAQSVRNS